MVGGDGWAEGDLALAIPRLLWIFLFFFISLLLSAAALAGVTMGTAASAVAYMASVKSPIANFLMRLFRCGWGNLVPMPIWCYTAPEQTFPRGGRTFVIFC